MTQRKFLECYQHDETCIRSVLQKLYAKIMDGNVYLIEIYNAKVCTYLTRGTRTVPLNIRISDMNETGCFSTRDPSDAEILIMRL